MSKIAATPAMKLALELILESVSLEQAKIHAEIGLKLFQDERIGMCQECKEWTTVKESCCGAPVLIEGDWVRTDE